MSVEHYASHIIDFRPKNLLFTEFFGITDLLKQQYEVKMFEDIEDTQDSFNQNVSKSGKVYGKRTKEINIDKTNDTTAK